MPSDPNGLPWVRQRSIVEVLVTAERGKTKYRPVLVITSDAEILAGEQIVGVAVSSSAYKNQPFTVELPWAINGKCKSGLNRPSVAVCNWILDFKSTDVKHHGYVTEDVFIKVLKAVEEYRATLR